MGAISPITEIEPGNYRGISDRAYLRVRKPIKNVTRRWVDDNVFVGAIVVYGLRRGYPTGVAERTALLKAVSRRRWPLHYRRVGCRQENLQSWRPRSLNGKETPKPASQRIVAARHRPSGIMLTNRSTERVLAVGTGASSASDLVPVDGVLLRKARSRYKNAQPKHQFLHNILVDLQIGLEFSGTRTHE